MTSTANQDQTPAQNPSAPSTTSYASAAGAAKKPIATPLSAAGSNPPPVVVGSSAPGGQQHGKPASASPVNGRQAITPALPATAPTAPAVAHGAATNGHDRKSSVTISANGPSGYIANGGPVGGSKGNIQFGYKESPAIAHSTPQQGTSAPIPIPGNNARVPSPAHSPSPIPQPSASGGRPPPMAQDGPSMKFGSLGGDGERHMKHLSQGPHPMGSGSPHMRHGSTHSVHDNAGGHGGPGIARGGGGFGPSGGRGRGGYNAGGYNNPMGYPPGQYGHGRGGGHSGQGRGGMNYPQNQRGMPPYQSSPQPRGSPAMGNAMPNPGTPTMNQSLPVHPPQQGFNAYIPPAYPNVNDTSCRHSPPKTKRTAGNRANPGGDAVKMTVVAVAPQRDQPRLQGAPLILNVASELDSTPLVYGEKIDLSPTSGGFDRLLTYKKQTYPFPPPFDPRQQSMMGMGYPQYPQMPPSIPYGIPPPGPSPSPGFQQPYTQGPYPPQAQPMSRNASQVSERPNSSTGHPQSQAVTQAPAAPVHAASAKPAVVSSSASFVIPKKAATKITIKNAAGEAVDLNSLKAPASPVPSVQQSKTPPVVSSSSTPPPKTTAPSHARSESSKTAEQLRSEFREQVFKSQTAGPPVEAKDAAPQTADAPADKPTTKAPGSGDEAVKADVADQEAPKAAADKPTETKDTPQTNAAPSETQAQAPETTVAEAEKEPAPEPKESEEEEMERMIREMEEAEAEREKKAAEYEAKKKVVLEEKKRLDEENRAKNAAENDRKLQEQEREMERLEEEREKKLAEAEAKESGKPTTDASAAKVTDAKESAAPGVSSVADKLASLSVGGTTASSSATKPGTTEGKRSKPAALNLAPLKTSSVEPPQPSAALQSLKSARFLEVIAPSLYPAGIQSPNPALNVAVARKGKSFKYDSNFLLQFQKVFTEQPSMEFGQQVKTLIGDGDGGSRSASARTPAPGSGRQNSRPGAGNFGGGGMGSGFIAPPSKLTQGPGDRMGPPPRGGINNMPGGMGSFGRFPGGNMMARTPSNSMNIPNSPRQGSRTTRGGSKRDFSAKNEAQAAKTMPLTQGLDLKPITVSAGGWKPRSIGNKAAAAPAGAAGELLEPEVVQRKVKAALNKMTPEKFEKIADQILTIAAQSKDEQDGRTLRQVIQLTFEKATDEAHWASMYAKFCKRMLDTMSPEIRDVSIVDKHGNVVSGGALFRKYLLNRCQEEFERGWKVDLPEPKEGDEPKAGEAVMLSDEYYIAAAAKRRGLGLVQFIGELYKLGMLTERIMHECVRKLVDYRGVPDEAEIESLSKLLRTIGGNLDVNTEKTQGKHMMDAYFQRIDAMVRMPELPSRLKFMLMDMVDLRRSGWHSKEANKGPKTLDEVRAEAEAAAAQKAAENARGNQRGGPGGRPPMGGRGGDGRGPSNYGQPAPNQNTIDMNDLRRLKGSATRTSSQNATFGPSSMFASRSNSGRANRLGAGGAFARAGEDSGASSRTGTPPTRESVNAFSLLANMETENPASPPSTAVSPALSKVTPDTTKGRA
ncbi:hypothetical protein RB598_007022 [Gaeumannomyces tritici]